MAKILCVEDEVDIRQILADELTDVGYDVVEAGDGRQGLEAIVDEKPDLILCDITMPVMDGHSMLAELRDNHPEQADTPFIFLSALADREHVLRGKALGADDYLTKPVDIDMLIATIDTRLRQIARMNKLKDEQLVKLYRSFNKPDSTTDQSTDKAPDPERPTSSAGRSAGTDQTGQAEQGSKPEPDSSESAAQPDSQKPTEATSDQPKPAEPERPDTGETPSGGEETIPFKDRVRALANRMDGRLVVAHASIAGLDDVKSALGPQWNNQSHRVNQVYAETIRSHVANEGEYECHADGFCVVCFSQRDEDGAQQKCEEIAASFRSLLQREDGLDKRIKEHGGLRLSVREISLTTAEIDRSEDVALTIKTLVTQSAEQPGAAELEALTEELASCRIVQVPVTSSKGNQTTLTVTRFDSRTQAAIQAVQDANAESVDTLCEIDIAKLEKSAQLLGKQANADQPNLIVDTHYTTVSRADLQRNYLAKCAKIGRNIMGQLALNIRRLPSGTPSQEVLSVIELLRRQGAKIMVELPTPSHDTIDPNALRVSIMTAEHQILMEQISSGDELKDAVSKLHDNKTLLLVHSVPDTDAAKQLFSSGVDLAALS